MNESKTHLSSGLAQMTLMVTGGGFEPPTCPMASDLSTTELPRNLNVRKGGVRRPPCLHKTPRLLLKKTEGSC